MCNRRKLTTFLTLLGVSALVGCISPRLEYANSHGYYHTWVTNSRSDYLVRLNNSQGDYVSMSSGKEYYCRPRLDDNSTTAATCLTLAEIEAVRTGKQAAPPPAPETVLDLPAGYRRVTIEDRQRICWYNNCYSSLAAAATDAKAVAVAPPPAFWPPTPSELTRADNAQP